MTGLTAHDREWVDAIAALRIADTARAVLTPDAPAVEPLGVVAEEIRGLIDRARGASGFYRHIEGPSRTLASIADDLTAVLDALGTGAGQAAVDALDEVERRITAEFKPLTEPDTISLPPEGMYRRGRNQMLGTALRVVDEVRAAVTSADDGDRDSGGETVGAG